MGRDKERFQLEVEEDDGGGRRRINRHLYPHNI